ncbi:hypothetical protein TH57_07585 [Bacillus amyloliquefaciens]|nr:hypothetical protein TH57_07585 [Bacillus amyloliquefaciens]KOS51563.1 hypothetical protein AN272_05360 [Bacillus amyloliquefaciens]
MYERDDFTGGLYSVSYCGVLPRFLMKNKKLHIRGNMQQQNENAWGKNLRSGQSALPHAGIIQIGL